jgi:hypothetical protein
MTFQSDAFQPDIRPLLLRMKATEDQFVERKTTADRKDWLKTAVAFANSTRESFDSILFIGVYDSGQIELHNNDLDTLQKTLRKELANAYPPIEYQSVAIQENGRHALAVIIPASKNRPHFAGPSYIRAGSETVMASEKQFNELIARRSSVVNKILEYKGKWVTVCNSPKYNPRIGESWWPGNTIVYDCDQFGVTLTNGDQPRDRQTFPLTQIDLSFDHQANRLTIKIDR